MAYTYAQLNEQDICIGVSQLGSEITESYMIPISEMDFEYYMLRVYDMQNKVWFNKRAVYNSQTGELDIVEI